MSPLSLTQLAFRIGTCALCCALIAATSPASPATRPATQPILPIPSEAAQAKAERMVREVYGKEMASRDPISRQALAQKLLRQALDSPDDPAARFVLLREARDIAASAGDAATAHRAIRQMAQFHRIDTPRILLAAMTTAHAAATTAEAQVAVAQTCLGAVDQAITADDYASATRFVSTAEAAATKAKNVPLITHVRERARVLQVIFLEFQSAQKAQEFLLHKPDDAESAARAGRFACLYKGEWSSGLALIARGADSALKTIAIEDLAASSNPAKRLSTAHGWWELAQTQPQPARKHLQLRAAFWYRQVLQDLSGINLAIVQKRLETVELDALREQNLFPGLAAELFKGIDFTNAVKLRIDEQINFEWGNEAIDPTVGKDNFAIRWSGLIKPPAAGAYELVIVANTGVRLWLDEKLISENPNLTRSRSGARVAVQLSDQLHPIRIEYWDTSGLARMKLLWRRPGASRDEVVPSSVFFHDPSAITPPAEQP